MSNFVFNHFFGFSIDITFLLLYNSCVMAEKKKISTKIKNYQIKEKKARKELLEVIESEIDNSKKPKEITIEKADFVEAKSNRDTATKMVAEKVWGVNKDKDASIGKKQRIIKRVFTLAFIIFVVGVLVYTAYNDFFAPGERELPSWDNIKALLVDSWFYLIVAIACLIGSLFAKGGKLAIMCKKMTGKVHFKTCFETGIIGTYYNNITPLAVGGQPFEIYHLSKHGVHGGVAASLPIAAYITNQLAFVILGGISLALYSTNALGLPAMLTDTFGVAFTAMTVVGMVCCSIMPLLVLLFCFMPKTCSKIVQFVMYLGGKMRLIRDPKKATVKTIKNIIHNADCLKKLAKSPFVLLSTFFLSFIEHILNASIAFFVLLAFTFPAKVLYPTGLPGFGLLYAQVLQMCFMLFLSVSFIPTPGNAGAADLSFFNLFQKGLPAGFAFPAMTLWRLFSFYSSIIIGFVFANVKKKNDKKREAIALEQASKQHEIQNALSSKIPSEVEQTLTDQPIDEDALDQTIIKDDQIT